jgi:probable rRNA maturation factor
VSVFVSNESGAEVDEQELARLARHVLDAMQVHPLAELSVLLVDVDAMEHYHREYLGESGPTDVLAFPQDDLGTLGPRDDGADEPEALLGDVLLCPQVAAGQARQAGHSLTDELHLLCTHGVLHLLGYDHGDAAEEREMFATQARLLQEWQAVRQRGWGP